MFKPCPQRLSRMQPFVSVLTPTYNRAHCMKRMVACYKAQTYPKDRMEWIVLDDSADPEATRTAFLAETKGLPNIRFLQLPEKHTVGAKRNMLNNAAKGEILVSWDDDDYYPPDRVAHVVKKFAQTPSASIAGSSQLFLYFTERKEIWQIGPYHAKHATNGTMATRASYAKSHRYDETVTFAEEASFTDQWAHPILQLDPMKVMLVMCSKDNTFDKEKLLDGTNPFVKKTSLKIKDFIKDSAIRELFLKRSEEKRSEEKRSEPT